MRGVLQPHAGAGGAPAGPPFAAQSPAAAKQPAVRGCHLPGASRWLLHAAPCRGVQGPGTTRKRCPPHQEGAGFGLDQQQPCKKNPPKPFPGWAGQGGMKVPAGFGAKSGLNAQALLHPGTGPGSTAPRSPLARSWPQKCQFCSNLGLKGVLGERRQMLAQRDLEKTLRGPSESPVEMPEEQQRGRVGAAGAISRDKHTGKHQGNTLAACRSPRTDKVPARSRQLPYTDNVARGKRHVPLSCPITHGGRTQGAETPQSLVVLAGSCPSPRGYGG